MLYFFNNGNILEIKLPFEAFLIASENSFSRCSSIYNVINYVIIHKNYVKYCFMNNLNIAYR